MLVRRILQHTARIPQRRASLVLHHLQFLRPLHTPSGDSDPQLNWTPGREEDTDEPFTEPEETQLWRPRIALEEHIKEPVLNWTSGYRTGDSFAPSTDPEPDLEDPELRWLPSRKHGVEVELEWDETISARLGQNIPQLLSAAALEKVRRRRTQPRDPAEGLLVKRYETFPQPPKLVRKTRWQRSASESELEEPAIKIGEAPVLGSRENPRVAERRLKFDPFAVETYGPKDTALNDTEAPQETSREDFNKLDHRPAENPQETSRIGIEDLPKLNRTPAKKPQPAPASPLRRIQSLKLEPSSFSVQRALEHEARVQEILDARLSAETPTRTTASVVSQPWKSHPEENHVTSTSVKKPGASLVRKTESSERPKVRSEIRSWEPKAEVESLENTHKTFRSTNQNTLWKDPESPFFIRRCSAETRKMDEPMSNAPEIINESVPNDTNIEIPTTQEPNSKPNLKRVSSPAHKTEGKPNKKQRGAKVKPAKEGGAEEVLDHDIQALLSALPPTDTPTPDLPAPFTTLDLIITSLSSTGDGLAIHNNRVYVIPFTLPGDTVTAKITRHERTHTNADFIKVLTPSPDRNDALIGCQYFASCSGCQFQMLPYDKQLEHKRRVVQKAFANFSGLPAELLPDVLETMGSPLEYGYRTKLTPHFNGPRRGGFKLDGPTPNIGFQAKAGRHVLDIEDCPIGTDTVREGMKRQRKWVKDNLQTYKRGATILLRESTTREPVEGEDGKYTETKQCITDSNERSVEYFGDFRFDSPAGSFFQNNNSILVKFTDYIRDNLNLPIPNPSTSTTTAPPKYLVDAYCGSGLFTVACGQGLTEVIGVDIDAKSIASAHQNAKLNNIANASFIAGNAEAIFANIKFPGAETSLIIDPPRKGCDKAFLDQMLDFAPKKIVYVSCNVHTQARDIGYVLMEERGKMYKVESIRGFDFFPQTHHVEGVAVLTRMD